MTPGLTVVRIVVARSLAEIPIGGPEYCQIERVVRDLQTEYRLPLEAQARREPPVAAARELEMRVDDVHAEEFRVGKQLRQARRDLARTASGIENPEWP